MGASRKALHSDGRFFRDREGRVVLLRGVNCGGDSKIPPFEPFATEASAEQIRRFGLDCVRYCTVWEALEPAEGEYDDRYLDRMAEIVGWLTSRGIFVFIDMHQDLFSRKFHGCGAPAWASSGDPSQLPVPNGGPHWFNNYPSRPVADAFERFWSSDSLQAHFLEALRRVARRFAGDPMVVGYEIWNEPWHGHRDVYSGDFEMNTLAPFYRRAIATVRAEDPGAIVFVEPALAAGGLIAAQSKLPRIGPENLAYSPHFYPLGALTGEEPDIDGAIAMIGLDLQLVTEKAHELGMPALLGEFGVHPRQPDGARFLRGYFDQLDSFQMSGTVWTYAPRDREWNDEGMSFVGPALEERPYVAELVRPYPMAMAGEPVRIRYDAAARRHRVELSGPASDAVTVIRAPARVYPDGVIAQCNVGRA